MRIDDIIWVLPGLPTCAWCYLDITSNPDSNPAGQLLWFHFPDEEPEVQGIRWLAQSHTPASGRSGIFTPGGPDSRRCIFPTTLFLCLSKNLSISVPIPSWLLSIWRSLSPPLSSHPPPDVQEWKYLRKWAEFLKTYIQMSGRLLHGWLN